MLDKHVALDRFQLFLPPPLDLGCDCRLVPLIARIVKDLPLQGCRQILLGDPVTAVGVRVEISFTVPEPLGVAAVVAEVVRNFALSFLGDFFQRVEEPHRRVGLFRGCKVEGGLSEVEAAFRQTDSFKRRGGGLDHHQCVGVGKTNVFGGADQHSSKDEPRLLAGVDHPGKPVEGGIGIAAPD
ncbi:MAG: hypothetical protein BWY50_01808 [Spirochaetes bacterium ADurb.Bin315]|nr:MAG: hypothetical protein BWY50_01808 [Spirochaetes bacterium ADurb.Bin315]